MNILLLGQVTNFRPLLVEALKQAGHEWQFPATRENAVALIQQQHIRLRGAVLFSCQ